MCGSATAVGGYTPCACHMIATTVLLNGSATATAAFRARLRVLLRPLDENVPTDGVLLAPQLVILTRRVGVPFHLPTHTQKPNTPSAREYGAGTKHTRSKPWGCRMSNRVSITTAAKVECICCNCFLINAHSAAGEAGKMTVCATVWSTNESRSTVRETQEKKQ